MTIPPAKPDRRRLSRKTNAGPSSTRADHAALAALLDSNGAAFRVLLENSRDGINFCELFLEGNHPARRLVFCNESFVEMSGRTLVELMGCPDLNELLEDDASPALRADYLAHMRAGKSFQGIGRWVRSDGRENVHEWVVIPIQLAGKHCVLGIDRDITERMLAQATIARERAEALMIFNSVPSLIWYKDTQNRILRVNRAAADALGKRIDEIEGRNTEELYPENAAAYYQDDLEVIRSRRPKFGIAESVPRVDGGKRWLVTNKVPQFDEHGEVIGLVVVAQDVTSLKEAEELRLALDRKMQETQRLESLGVLAGGIAHDFNNLLTGIIGNTSLARLELPSDSRTHRLFDQIEKASTRAADLCREMLAYAGKGRFLVEAVNLSHVVTETTHLLQSSIDKNTTLRFHLAEDLPPVLADVTQIRQVIMNLVINASEAMAGRAGEVAVVTGHVHADREFLDGAVMAPDLPEGDYAFLEVTDKGCGMSPATVARVFDPFFTTKFTGRGLGLAAVLGIVRGHHGALKVRSKLDSGTTFQILLPCVPGETTAPPALPERTGPWRGIGTILLVDDEETVRSAGQLMLHSLGFDVITAENGREGVRIYLERASEIVAVLLDLTMPQMDGEATFRELRRLRPDVKVALMSGYNEQYATQHFIGRDLAAFLQKPFDLATLRRTLQGLPVGESN